MDRATARPSIRRGEGLGFFGMATGVAQTLTPAIGVAVAAVWGFDVVFLIAAGTVALTLLLTQRVSEPPLGPVHPEETGTLFPRQALFPISIFMTVTFAFAATASFLPLLGDERGLGTWGRSSSSRAPRTSWRVTLPVRCPTAWGASPCRFAASR